MTYWAWGSITNTTIHQYTFMTYWAWGLRVTGGAYLLSELSVLTSLAKSLVAPAFEIKLEINKNTANPSISFTLLVTLFYLLFDTIITFILPFCAKILADKFTNNTTRAIEHAATFRDRIVGQPPNPSYFFHVPRMSGRLPPVQNPAQISQTVTTTMPLLFPRHIRYPNGIRISDLIHTPFGSAPSDSDSDSGTSADADMTVTVHVDPASVRRSYKIFQIDTCPICIVKFPLLEIKSVTLAAIAPCKHIFCYTCIDEHMRAHDESPSCPLCRKPILALYVTTNEHAQINKLLT
jgi:hypothetical protein